MSRYEWVLYVDLPIHGQVSFHCAQRYAGPDYVHDWDGMKMSPQRIMAFTAAVLAKEAHGSL